VDVEGVGRKRVAGEGGEGSVGCEEEVAGKGESTVLVEKVNQLSQTDCLEAEAKVGVVETATQTEQRKGERAIHIGELDMIMGEDSSPSEVAVKDDASVTAPPVIKKQVE